jgi:hypothetical protein
MGRLCVAGRQDFGRKKLDKYSTEQGKTVSSFEEGQSPHRAVEPVMMKVIPDLSTRRRQALRKATNNLRITRIGRDSRHMPNSNVLKITCFMNFYRTV